MKTIGLDLSLNSTGWAVLEADEQIREPWISHHGTFSTAPRRGAPKQRMEERLNALYGWIMQKVVEEKPGLVAIEAASFGSITAGGGNERIALQWCIRMALDRLNIDFVMVEPTSLKKAWTGSGRAEKADMCEEALRRYGVEVEADDVADAIALAWVAAQVQGYIPAEFSALELVHRLKSGGCE